MSVLKHAPSLSAREAERVVDELYGIRGSASPLPSERDQNFRIDSSAGSYVLKIANATDDRALLLAQNAAMTHAAAHGVPCPAVVATAAGTSVEHREGHDLRLVTWLDGVPLAAFRHHSVGLLQHVGRAVGRLDAALAGFDAPAVHRSFDWDLASAADLVRDHLDLVTDPALRATVGQIAAEAGALAGTIASLPRSVIHNDPNDHNLLVVGTDVVYARDQRVSGVIDFGDMVHGITIADLAIAIAYAVLDAREPFRAASAIVRGYSAERPLAPAEREVLWPLVLLRLALSVCMAARQQRERPGDEYLGVSQEPIRRTLPRLLDAAAAARTIQSACQDAEGVARRRRSTGGSVRLAYDEPVALVRGSMQYVFDRAGRRYLDGYNNVPHVGHSHPRVADAAASQMRLLNTNTRYLHDGLASFAERLAATCPPPLEVCYFLNSGSEANELALRLARAHTRQRDVIVLDAAYHGHTTTLIEISPYKFDGPGGEGPAPWVHVAPIPDVFRGPFKKDDPRAGERYARPVGDIVARLRDAGRGLSAFIAETCPSVGGQILPPDGYLAAVYAHVREAGGVCIADEVQTGYGRMGSSFYAFEDQRVVPDIVVLGKPIGNGYPLAAVITTPAIAASFDNGMEFFSTFGGSTVSMAVGAAVLDIVQSLDLQQHADRVGRHLMGRLRALPDRYPLVGDVRGAGLFVGIELVRDRASLEPAADEASFIVNQMRADGVLIGTDGPFHNVLKVRPPMPFNARDADALADALQRGLDETST